MCYEECDKICNVIIREIGDCGHVLEGICGDIKNIKCQTKVCYIYIYIILLSYWCRSQIIIRIFFYLGKRNIKLWA